MTEPGIRQQIYLDGHRFDNDPTSLAAPPSFGETVRRVRDGSLRADTHRAAVTDADVSAKFRFEIAWETFSAGDVTAFLRCVARRGPFLFCPWFMWCESFSFLEGETIAGNLLYGSAKTEIPESLGIGTPATDYDVLFELDGVASTDFAVSPMVGYRTPWASSPLATAGVGGAVVDVFYAPFFLVRVADQAIDLRSAQQGGKLVLEVY